MLLLHFNLLILFTCCYNSRAGREKGDFKSSTETTECLSGNFQYNTTVTFPSSSNQTLSSKVPESTKSTTNSKNHASPNIIIVVLDDVGWAGLRGYNGGVSGDQYPTTPHMDRSIKQGIKLTNLYVQAMCSPTRGALMTGRFPHRYGGQHFVQQPYQPTWIPEDETTLAEKMKALGYKTSIGECLSVL